MISIGNKPTRQKLRKNLHSLVLGRKPKKRMYFSYFLFPKRTFKQLTVALTRIMNAIALIMLYPN